MPNTLLTDDLRGLGLSPAMSRLLRTMERAPDFNPTDLPAYGSGPTAGLTAPTVTWAAAVTAANTKQFAWTDADQSFAQVCGGQPAQIAGSQYGFPVVTLPAGDSSIVGTSGKGGAVWAVETLTDDPTPNFRIPYNTAFQVRLAVDGQYLTKAPAPMPNNNSGGIQFLQIAFGSASSRMRRIRVEMEGSIAMSSLYVAPTSRLYRPFYPDFVRAAVIGDSYDAYRTQGDTPNSYGHDNSGAIAMRSLGVHDANHLAIGGTGYTFSAGGSLFGSDARMADLAALQALPGGLSLVILRGSINDRNASAADLKAAAQACFSRVRAIVGPGVPVIQTGMPAAGQPIVGIQACEQALKDAVAAQGDTMLGFAPFSLLTPLPGTDASNKALYVQADNVHYSAAAVPGAGGMEYVGRLTAATVRQAVLGLLK